MNSRGARNQSLGKLGEELAAAFLQRKGYRILERNYRCRCGEVDVVAKDGKSIVFVEVKTRRSQCCGDPQQSVTLFKQSQISRAAQTWLAANNLQDASARFDVVAISLDESDRPRIDHIENAFDLR